ncbi:unnamed protein product, partial [Amoebophrya sp. A120]
ARLFLERPEDDTSAALLILRWQQQQIARQHSSAMMSVLNSAALAVPQHPEYSKPSEKNFCGATIRAIAEHHCQNKKERGSAIAAKREDGRDAISQIEELSQQAFCQNQNFSSELLTAFPSGQNRMWTKQMINDTVNDINGAFGCWRAANQLHQFVQNLTSAIRTTASAVEIFNRGSVATNSSGSAAATRSQVQQTQRNVAVSASSSNTRASPKQDYGGPPHGNGRWRRHFSFTESVEADFLFQQREVSAGSTLTQTTTQSTPAYEKKSDRVIVPRSTNSTTLGDPTDIASNSPERAIITPLSTSAGSTKSGSAQPQRFEDTQSPFEKIDCGGAQYRQMHGDQNQAAESALSGLFFMPSPNGFWDHLKQANEKAETKRRRRGASPTSNKNVHSAPASSRNVVATADDHDSFFSTSSLPRAQVVPSLQDIANHLQEDRERSWSAAKKFLIGKELLQRVPQTAAAHDEMERYMKRVCADMQIHMRKARCDVEQEFHSTRLSSASDGTAAPAFACGILAPITPVPLARWWCRKQREVNCIRRGGNSVDQRLLGLLSCVTTYLLKVRLYQRAKRILLLVSQNDWSTKLQQEVDNIGWTEPERYPGVLAFEVDNNLCVWDSQAALMREFAGATENQLTQCSMGQGKTAVVMPLLPELLCDVTLSRASDIDSCPGFSKRLTRATVLPSLLPDNARDWQHKLGGIVNKKVFALRFSRERNHSQGQCYKLLLDLKRHQAEGGMLIMTPEDRMSLECKTIALAYHNKAKKLERPEATSFSGVLDVARFLEDNCVNILDECDEMLAPRNQLAYTLGDASALDGGDERYAAAALVLRCASAEGEALLADPEFGRDVIEIEGGAPGRPQAGQFTPLRLLDHPKQSSAYGRLQLKIVKQVRIRLLERYREEHLSDEDLKNWEHAVLQERPANYFAALPNEDIRKLARIYRGLLLYGVLKKVLTMRYRVQYGAPIG